MPSLHIVFGLPGRIIRRNLSSQAINAVMPSTILPLEKGTDVRGKTGTAFQEPCQGQWVVSNNRFLVVRFYQKKITEDLR